MDNRDQLPWSARRNLLDLNGGQKSRIPRYYQSPITRLPALLALVAIALGLIGVLEYASRTLPSRDANGFLTSTIATAINGSSELLNARSDRLARQLKPTKFGDPLQSGYLPMNTHESSLPQTTGSPPFHDLIASAPAPSDYLPTSTVASEAPSSTDYLPVAAAAISVSTPAPVPTPAPSNYLSTAPSAPEPSSFLPASPNYLPKQAFDNTHGLSPSQYVLGAFVPTIIAVVLSIPLLILDSAIQELEPFYQMSRPGGASAAKSICLNYAASIRMIVALISIWNSHYVVLWSSLLTFAALFLAPLASEAVFIGFIGHCTATSGRDACIPSLSIFTPAARALQGTLAFIAVLTLLLAVSYCRRNSGLFADPLCIAGTASLFQDPELVSHFCILDPNLSDSKQLLKTLRGRRYRLEAGSIVSYPYAQVYFGHNIGGVFGQEGKSDSVRISNAGKGVHRNQRTQTRKMNLDRVLSLISGLLTTGLLILVIYYNHTGGDTGFERFMDSQSFGPRFLFTTLGVIFKLYWCGEWCKLQRLEPYRYLLQGNARAEDSILFRSHANPFAGLAASLAHRHAFPAFVSFLAILCEPLTIALTNIPFQAGTTFEAYNVCTYISVGILSLMVIGITWSFWRGPVTGLPREPDTIASVMLYLCASRMRENFEGMATLSGKERDDRVKKWRKNYRFGQVMGVDGVQRTGIDDSDLVIGMSH